MHARVLALFWLIAKIILLLAGLLLPGAALMRALRLPATLATSFAGSAVALYATLLALQLGSLRIALGSLAAGLALVTALSLIVAGVRRGPPPHEFDPIGPIRPIGPIGPIRVREALGAHLPPLSLALYALFWLIVLWRAWHEPLAGPDIEFRWSFLAEQMLRTGSLDFYPPRSARDFLSYFWAESIPPGASSLHAWAYACAGGASAAWTVPVVALQIVSLHALLWRTAAHLAGPRAGACACLAAAACPLLTWSMLLGQETGLTALSLVGLVFALEAWQRERAARWAALAGIFAVLGAMAREYGLVFPVLAAAGLLIARGSRQAWLAFVLAAALALVWPVRVWLLTGNPFHSLALGGLPVNSRFIAWIEHDAAALGASLSTAGGWLDLARYFGLFAPAALAGWIVLLVATTRRHRHAACLLVASALILALWAASVRYTNGGLFYSLRVASPALALGALALGLASARNCERQRVPPPEAPLAGARSSAWARPDLILATLLALTLPATLALPRNPLRTPPRDWSAFAPQPEPPAIDETVALILRTGAPGTVLADSPGFQRRFLPHGVPVIPLWSPQADWLFDPSLPPREAARRWRASGVRHVVLAKWQSNLDFFNTQSRWGKPPFHVQLIGETPLTVVFALSADE